MNILFENKKMGQFPYRNYNCSILKLNNEETLKITNKKFNQQSVLIIFFVSSSNNILNMGIMSFIGLISFDLLNIYLKNENDVNFQNFWLIKPHLLQNDKGPKCADLRIFKMKQNIGVIGYSRVAPHSNTDKIADYYVRASILNTRINESLYNDSSKLYHFKEIDGGCFPSKIGNDYKKFKTDNDNNKIKNIEFFIKDNKCAKLINPHKSKNPNMPSSMKLNGIEISFSKISTNEDSTNHISSKNVIPLQHIKLLDNICGFIDVFPPNNNNPTLTIQNLESGKVLMTHLLNVKSNLKSKKFKGSTPFLELSNNMWITMVHQRYSSLNSKRGFMYKYYFQIYDSKKITIDNNVFNIPNKCIKEILFQEKELSRSDFVFIMGMIVNKEFHKRNKLNLELIISYGISDEKSGISLVKLDIKLR